MTTTTRVPSCLPAGFAFLADETTLPADKLVVAIVLDPLLSYNTDELPSDHVCWR